MNSSSEDALDKRETQPRGPRVVNPVNIDTFLALQYPIFVAWPSCHLWSKQKFLKFDVNRKIIFRLGIGLNMTRAGRSHALPVLDLGLTLILWPEMYTITCIAGKFLKLRLWGFTSV